MDRIESQNQLDGFGRAYRFARGTGMDPKQAERLARSQLEAQAALDPDTFALAKRAGLVGEPLGWVMDEANVSRADRDNVAIAYVIGRQEMAEGLGHAAGLLRRGPEVNPYEDVEGPSLHKLWEWARRRATAMSPKAVHS